MRTTSYDVKPANSNRATTGLWLAHGARYCSSGRLLAGILVLLLLLSFYTAASAGDAWMDLYSYSYGPNDIVMVDLGFVDFYPSSFWGNCTSCPPPGKCDTYMGVNISARCYIVPHGTVLNDGTNLDSLSVAPYHVILQPSSTSGFWDEPLGVTRPQGRIGDGTYDIVIDECEDGSYTDNVLSQDTVVATFSVSGTTALGVKLNPAISHMKQEAQRQYDLWTSYRDDLKHFRMALKCITYARIAVHIGLNAWEWYDGVAPNFGWIVPQAYGISMGKARDAVFDQIKAAQEATIRHWEAIKNDPPDPVYNIDVELGAIDYHQAASSDQLDQSSTRVANLSTQQAAVLQALLSAMEKFQGARDADDKLNAIKQARAVARYSKLAADLAQRNVMALSEMTSVLAVTPGDFEAAASRLAEIQSRVRPDGSGFNEAELACFEGAGLDPAKYPIIAQEILAAEVSPDPIRGLTTHSENLTTSVSVNVEELQRLASEAQNEIAEWLPLVTPFPVADAGDAYSGTVGNPVTVSAILTTDPDTSQGALTFTWDMDGDGVFDDASGISPSFTYMQPYEGFIGVRVRDTEGHTDVDYALLTATKTNSAPNVAQQPTESRLLAVPGSVLNFSIAISDDDGDTLSAIWKLDDNVVQQGGLAYAYSPTVGDKGMHKVAAIVSDGNSSSPDGLAEWVVMVSDIPVTGVSPSVVDFGVVPVGLPTTQMIRISNAGTITLETNAPVLSAGSPADFRVVSPTGPMSIAPGAYVDIVVEFLPTTEEPKLGAVEFSTNDIAMPCATIPLTNRVTFVTNLAKQQPDGQGVMLNDMIVSALWSGSPWIGYVQDGLKASAIRIEGTGSAPLPGDRGSVAGFMGTAGPERTLTSTVFTSDSHIGPPGPLSVAIIQLGGGDWLFNPLLKIGQRGVTGGHGLNNLGLLVRVYGRVCSVETVTAPARPTWFMVDDGSVVNAKCLVPVGVNIDPQWNRIIVTGISSCESAGDEIHRLIRVRTQEDIVPIQ